MTLSPRIAPLPATAPPERRDDTADLSIDDWLDRDPDSFTAAMHDAFESKWEDVLLDLLNSRSRTLHHTDTQVLERAMERALAREISNATEWVREWQWEQANGMDE